MKNKKSYPAFRKQPSFSKNSSINKIKVENELYENVLKLLEENNVVIVHNSNKEEAKLNKEVNQLKLQITNLSKDNGELKQDIIKLKENNTFLKQKNAQLNNKNRYIVTKTLTQDDFDSIYKMAFRDNKWTVKTKEDKTFESTSAFMAIKKANGIED